MSKKCLRLPKLRRDSRGWSISAAFRRSMALLKPWFFTSCLQHQDFPGGSDGKASAYNAGDQGSIPGWGRSPGEGNGKPLQYSCLWNLIDRGAWWATVCGVAKSGTRLRWLNMHTYQTYILQTCKISSLEDEGNKPWESQVICSRSHRSWIWWELSFSSWVICLFLCLLIQVCPLPSGGFYYEQW